MTDFLDKPTAALGKLAGRTIEITAKLERQASFQFLHSCGCCQKFLDGVKKGAMATDGDYQQHSLYRNAKRTLPRQLHRAFDAGVKAAMETKREHWNDNPLLMKIVGIMAKPLEGEIMKKHCEKDKQLHAAFNARPVFKSPEEPPHA